MKDLLIDQLNENPIHQWLEDPDREYFAGVQLLIRAGKNRILANNLLKKKSTGNEDKLVYELTKLSGWQANAADGQELPGTHHDQPQELVFENGTRIPVPEIHHQVDLPGRGTVTVMPPVPELPAEIQDDYTRTALRMKELFQEKCKVSNTLADLTSDEERKKAMDKLEQIAKEYNELFLRQNYITKEGKLPALPEEPAAAAAPSESLAQLQLKRKQLAPNVSKAKKKHEAKPKDAELQTKYVKLSAGLADIDHQIKVLKASGESNGE